MRARLEGNRLIIRDQPFGFWLFYSFFVAGGSIALILSLTAAPDATTSLIGSIIGLGNIAGGLYMIKHEPASIVEIDKENDMVSDLDW
jgi:phosphate/sulfate permease